MVHQQCNTTSFLNAENEFIKGKRLLQTPKCLNHLHHAQDRLPGYTSLQTVGQIFNWYKFNEATAICIKCKSNTICLVTWS